MKFEQKKMLPHKEIEVRKLNETHVIHTALTHTPLSRLKNGFHSVRQCVRLYYLCTPIAKGFIFSTRRVIYANNQPEYEHCCLNVKW